MMRALGLGGLIALLLAVGAPVAGAQSTADAFFHEAAQQYVADNVPAARRAVEKGLAEVPSDPRLIALREKLEQGGRPEERRDDSSSDSEENGGAESTPDGNETTEEGENGSEGDEDRTTQGLQDSSATGAPRSESPMAPPSSPGPQESKRGGQGGRPVDTLSREQAERFLRTLEGKERPLLRLRAPSATERTVEKEW